MGAGPLCPDHLDLLADRGQEDAVITSISTWLRRPGRRLLNLEGIDADSLVINALPASVHREALAVAPWAALPADPDAYLAARPALSRKNLRRASSRLAAEGANHRVKRGSSAIRSLDTLRQLHDAQWGNRSRFLPSFDRFAAGCRLAAEVDEVAVHELAIGESVIAIVVAFEVAGRISLYQGARLIDFRWRDATTVLLQRHHPRRMYPGIHRGRLSPWGRGVQEQLRTRATTATEAEGDQRQLHRGDPECRDSCTQSQAPSTVASNRVLNRDAGRRSAVPARRSRLTMHLREQETQAAAGAASLMRAAMLVLPAAPGALGFTPVGLLSLFLLLVTVTRGSPGSTMRGLLRRVGWKAAVLPVGLLTVAAVVVGITGWPNSEAAWRPRAGTAATGQDVQRVAR